MNHDAKLKLQAYFDKELDTRENLEIANWLERDPEARALVSEFADVKTLLRENELETPVPETREFYWSKIERAIRENASSRAEREAATPHRWWMRILAPAVGAAVLVVAALSLTRVTQGTRSSYVQEIETPIEDMNTISFHSPSAGMTVVWVQSDSD